MSSIFNNIVIIIETCCNWARCTVADKEKIAAAEESDVQAAAKAAQESSPPQAQVLPVNKEQVGADAQISTAATESNCESVMIMMHVICMTKIKSVNASVHRPGIRRRELMACHPEPWIRFLITVPLCHSHLHLQPEKITMTGNCQRMTGRP